MQKAMQNDWVEIENVVLTSAQRAPQVPDDTKKTPMMMWTRGKLQAQEAVLGDEVTVLTLSGRLATGKLVDLKPRYAHDFGYPVKELIETGLNLKDEIGGAK